MIDWRELRLEFNLAFDTNYKTTDDLLLGLYLRTGSDRGVMKTLSISRSALNKKLQRAKSNMVSKLERGEARWKK